MTLGHRSVPEAEADTLGWLAIAGYNYQALREENAPKVKRMSWLSGLLGVLMIVRLSHRTRSGHFLPRSA